MLPLTSKLWSGVVWLILEKFSKKCRSLEYFVCNICDLNIGFEIDETIDFWGFSGAGWFLG